MLLSEPEEKNMAVGKYSPTVVEAYYADQNWFEKNCDLDEYGHAQYDRDGYDSYGYDKNDRDRAGVQEYEYGFGEDLNGEWVYLRYEQVLDKWTFNKETGKPAARNA